MLGMAPTQRNRELSNAVVVQALRAVVCRRPPNPHARKTAQSRPESRASSNCSSACSQFGLPVRASDSDSHPKRWAESCKLGQSCEIWASLALWNSNSHARSSPIPSTLAPEPVNSGTPHRSSRHRPHACSGRGSELDAGTVLSFFLTPFSLIRRIIMSGQSL